MQSVIVTKNEAHKPATNPRGHRLQSRISKYSCPIDNCNRSFSRLSNLNRHYRNSKDLQHRILAESCDSTECRGCGEQFSTTTLRERHENSYPILVDITGLDVLPFPKTSLSSFNPEEDHLIKFYVRRLAPSRTLYEHRDLYMELLDLSSSFDYLRHSIRSLAKSYFKSDSSKNAGIQWRVAAFNGLQNRVKAIGHTGLEDRREMKAILGCTALLLQYAVKTPSLHKEWSDMVRALGPLIGWAIPYPETLDLRMRLAAHYVLANTAICSAMQFPSAPFLAKSEEGTQQIDGSICLSPQMLNLIQRITLLNNQFDAITLTQEIRELEQVLSDSTIDPEAAPEVILNTADTFRLGAQEYTNCRFPGTIPNKEMKPVRYKLLDILEALPLTGRLYTSMHNLWGVFMCAVGKINRSRLDKILSKIEHSIQSNICPIVTLIRNVIWKTNAIHWENITKDCGVPSLT